ncbi:hypothetical protein [Streptomyces sp. AP-93]|nr:hypothetical protein [Streptomyces sp. AP-93]MCJ0872000.1 hypothetical protein [Streptomyces sp. AP-93]
MSTLVPLFVLAGLLLGPAATAAASAPYVAHGSAPQVRLGTDRPIA